MVCEYVSGIRDGHWIEVPDSMADVGFVLHTLDGDYRLVEILHLTGGHCPSPNATPVDQYVLGRLEAVT